MQKAADMHDDTYVDALKTLDYYIRMLYDS